MEYDLLESHYHLASRICSELKSVTVMNAPIIYR